MKPEFLIKKQKDGMHLIIKGDLTMQGGLALKNNLMNLLSAKGDVKISLQEIQSIDTSAIQLLVAFDKAFQQTKRLVDITWPESKSVNELITKAGIKQVLQ
jgi:ABC-type transporter Mla MlaB component